MLQSQFPLFPSRVIHVFFINGDRAQIFSSVPKLLLIFRCLIFIVPILFDDCAVQHIFRKSAFFNHMLAIANISRDIFIFRNSIIRTFGLCMKSVNQQKSALARYFHRQIQLYPRTTTKGYRNLMKHLLKKESDLSMKKEKK